MVTTSLKLSDDLKQRTAALAEQMGISTHAFMVGAIEQAATAAEQRRRFIADALAAKSEIEETGLGYGADEVHAWLKAKVAGKKAPKPKAKPWRK